MTCCIRIFEWIKIKGEKKKQEFYGINRNNRLLCKEGDLIEIEIKNDCFYKRYYYSIYPSYCGCIWKKNYHFREAPMANSVLRLKNIIDLLNQEQSWFFYHELNRILI